MLSVPVPLSEVIDRLTILEIKQRRVADPTRLAAVEAWANALRSAWADAGLPEPPTLPEHARLIEVNEALWRVEDQLRAREDAGDFGADFVRDARSVYQLNDRRAALKAALDQRLGSALIDVKTHRDRG